MTKKILNKNVDCVVEEMFAGFLSAYKKYYRRIDSYTAFKYRNSRKDKVAFVIGGGSGHEPLFPGFVGSGLADAAACGNVCASPNPEIVYAAGKAVDQGRGVIFSYGCYAGDNLNFDMGEEMLNQEGIRTAHVRVWDDCVSAPKERITDRRGIAGDVFVFKVIGGACDVGLDFDEVLRVGEKARDHTSSIGIATAPCTLPGNEKPTFELADDEIEFGMGLHGEAGIERTKMMPAEEIVARMYFELQKEMNLKRGEEIAVLVNGLGSTPLLELNLVYYDLEKLLSKDGIQVYDAEIKAWCTSQEMGGFSITFMRLDNELKTYYDMPCYTPYYAKGCVVETAVAFEDEGDEEPAFDGADTLPTVIARSKSGVLDDLNADDARNMLLYVADKIIENKSYLTEVDSAIGDGDHGIGMAGGMQKVRRKLASMTGEKNAYKLFEETGKAMLMSMGGASGVIFGSLFLAGAKDMPRKDALTGDDLAQMAQTSLASIQERGGAKPGDKTMVDALAPAAEAMNKARGRSLLEVLICAEEGAKEGMENTKNYIAKFGRAKSLLERAIGHQDAGATSVYIIYKAMREFAEGKLS